MTQLPRICILSFSNIAWDSRVLREIEVAAAQFQVDVIGFGDWKPIKGVRFFPVIKTKRSNTYLTRYMVMLMTGKFTPAIYESFYWSKLEYRAALEILFREKYDLVHANDWDALPVASRAAQRIGTRVLFDAHEYTIEQEADRPFWKMTVGSFRDYFLRSYSEPVQRMITVSDGVKELYRQNYGWTMDLVLNAPHYYPSAFRPTNPDQIQLVHHGGALPSRYIEDFINLTAALDRRFTMNFILMPTAPRYYKRLREQAAKIAPGRVKFLDPVPPSKILETLAQFDIGIPLMKVQQLSYYYSLPNKFFDYVIAGLCVAVSPLPAMQEIVEQHHLGLVATDQSWQSMSDCLNQLTAPVIDSYKQSSLAFAKDCNAEIEMKKLTNIYQGMLFS